MMASRSVLDGLKGRRPEWGPWLAVVEEVLREADGPGWDAAVPSGLNAHGSESPLLSGVAFRVPAGSIRRFFERLVRCDAGATTPKLASVKPLLRRDAEVLTLFTASLSQNSDRVTAIADAAGADAEALHAIVALLCVPLLQACNRRWTSAVSSAWRQGYCPVCGAWPAFAEVRGIERSRCLRCGRCGCAWLAPALRCPYCRTGDHHELVELVPEKHRSHAVISACLRCHGFVKTLIVLQGCPPGAVMLEDLASVDLDVAAIEQDYVRPPGAGYPLAATVTE